MDFLRSIESTIDSYKVCMQDYERAAKEAIDSGAYTAAIHDITQAQAYKLAASELSFQYDMLLIEEGKASPFALLTPDAIEGDAQHV